MLSFAKKRRQNQQTKQVASLVIGASKTIFGPEITDQLSALQACSALSTIFKSNTSPAIFDVTQANVEDVDVAKLKHL